MSFSLLSLKKIKEDIIHRGELLKKVVSESDFSVTDVVRLMKYASRNTFYNHLRKPNLSLTLLTKYGRVIHYDFGQDIPGMEKMSTVEDPTLYLSKPADLEEATTQRDYYHRMYVRSLEQIRQLEAENNALRNGTAPIEP